MTRSGLSDARLRLSLLGTSLVAVVPSGHYYGGRTTVGATKKTDLQSNSRLGLTLSLAWQTLWFSGSDKP